MADEEVQINVPEALRGGVWSNFAVVAHSPFEFTIDFIRMEPSGGGIVVSRVNLSPLMVSQLMEALETNWKIYAEKALPPAGS